MLADFVTVDVSFISLKKVLPKALELTNEKAQFVCLIKPQFEAGRGKVGKRGVVKEIETHKDVIKDIVGFLKKNGLHVLGLTFSPIKGPEGNIEFLVYFSKSIEGEIDFRAEETDDDLVNIIDKVVAEAHGVM
jgi:23S rRNA (cytidine1920-2'-O)/16S rRNA (cytidine1409-2'-O)-methyltransferase